MAPVIRSRYEQYKRDTQQFTTWLAQTAISLGYPLSRFDHEAGNDVEIIVRSAASKKNARKKARAKELAQLAQEGLGKDDEITPSDASLDASGDQDSRRLAGKSVEGLAMNNVNGMPGASQAAYRDHKEDGLSSNLGCEGLDVKTKNALSSKKPDLAQQPAGPKSSGRYTLKLSLYIEIVQYIVDNGAAIPLEVIRILKRCISLRLRASLQFAPTPESESSDKSHQYFIGILVQIRGIFERVNSTLDPSDPITTQNQFTELSSDESEDNAEDVPDIDIPRVASSNLSFEPEMVMMEAINAIVMFLGDMERTRVYLGALWRDYKSGKIDLITASVTTNTAIQIMQRPHDKLMKRVMPVFGDDFRRMVSMTFGQLRGRKTGQLDPDMPKFDLVDDQDIEMGKLYDFMMLSFVQICDELADNHDFGPSPFPRPGRFGKYDPNVALNKLSFRSRWQQYHMLSIEAFTHIGFLLGSTVGLGIQDGSIFDPEVNIRLIDRFMRTKKLSFHLTFAMRIHMDMNLILGPDTGRGCQYLYETAGRMIHTLSQRPAFQGTVPHYRWDDWDDQIVDTLLTHANMMSDLVARGCPISSAIRCCVVYPFSDYKSHIRTRAWHLPTLSPRSNPPPISTRLVDILVNPLERIHYPGGSTWNLCWNCTAKNRPLEEAFRQPSTSHSKLAKTLPASQAKWSTATRLSCATPVANPLAKPGSRYSETRPRSFLKENFHEHSKTAVEDDVTAIELLLRDLEAREDHYLRTAKGRKSGRREFRKEKKHRAAKFSIIQLLSILEKGLQLETTSIRFDYVSMHLRCMRIFRDMKEMCDPYFAGKLKVISVGNCAPPSGSSYIENDAVLPSRTGWILNHAEIQEGKVFKTRPKSSQILSKASNVFRQVLEIEGAGQVETLKVEYDRTK